MKGSSMKLNHVSTFSGKVKGKFLRKRQSHFKLSLLVVVSICKESFGR